MIMPVAVLVSIFFARRAIDSNMFSNFTHVRMSNIPTTTALQEPHTGGAPPVLAPRSRALIIPLVGRYKQPEHAALDFLRFWCDVGWWPCSYVAREVCLIECSISLPTDIHHKKEQSHETNTAPIVYLDTVLLLVTRYQVRWKHVGSSSSIL